MPKISNNNEVPEKLKPFAFHGMDFKISGKEALAECPFCNKEGKFSVKIETGTWRCLSCNTGSKSSKLRKGGNVYTFIRKLHEAGSTEDYSDLMADKGYLDEETLRLWGIVKSPINGHWIVPAHNLDGSLVQLYRYARVKGKNGEWKSRLLATTGLGQKLCGIPLFSKRKKTTYICEGVWDAMALWEVLKRAKALPKCNVLSIPGCGTFEPYWTDLFKGHRVVLMLDNDHPRQVNGQEIPSATFTAIQTISAILKTAKSPPESVSYLNWGEEGYNPELPSGTDIRDIIHSTKSPSGRNAEFNALLDLVEETPLEWVEQWKKSPRNETTSSIVPIPCDNYKTLTDSWRKGYKWIEGLDTALSVMLASVTSTMFRGDQLWVKIIGPAACGKTSLCDGLASASKYIYSKSTIRGFYSGFDPSGTGEEDNSLIVQVNGKTLVTKDGDTLLQSPNLGQILSEARDIYDGRGGTHYRNKASKDYDDIRMTWALCGTSSLRSIDSSELGERFLDCVIMEGIDTDVEDDILQRQADTVASSFGGGEDSSNVEHQLRAKALTGGYVDYLRSNAEDLVPLVKITESTKKNVIALAKFVAYMRARPSKHQDENAERELATRLVSQLLRLGKFLAVVLNRKSVDSKVLRRVAQVAFDTARGQTLEVAHLLYTHPDGMNRGSIATVTNRSDADMSIMLRFLRLIGVVEVFSREAAKGVKTRPRWRLTERFNTLYSQVLDIKESNA